MFSKKDGVQWFGKANNQRDPFCGMSQILQSFGNFFVKRKALEWDPKRSVAGCHGSSVPH